MRRTIVAVVGGYFLMVLLIFTLFSLIWMTAGPDALFADGSYSAGPGWIAQGLVVSFVAALAAGALAARAGGASSARALAVVIIVIGVAMAWPAINAWEDGRPIDRPAGVSMTEAAQNARQPAAVALALPFVGAAGAWIGGIGFGRRRP